MEKEKRNGPTNAGTCTSIVWAHRGAVVPIGRLYPPKNIIIRYLINLQASAVTLGVAVRRDHLANDQL